MRPTVAPHYISGNGLWNIFSGKKGYDVVCGSCQFTYHDKVPFVIDAARSICPCCGAVNAWLHSRFQAIYDESLAQVER